MSKQRSGETLGETIKSRKAAAAAGLIAITAALTGCSGGEDFAMRPAAAAPPANGGSYDSIEDLKDAAVKAGLDCPDWDQHNDAVLAEYSASCSTSSGMALYSSKSQMSRQLEAWEVIGEMVVLERLVGENWTIDVEDPEALQKKLGGKIFRTPGK